MDRFKLEYERKSKGLSVSELCEAANMSRSAYYRKCNGSSEFTQKEIQAICDVLKLKSPVEIFFTDLVS